MGTDNLFHKSRARQEKKLARKKRNRASFDKILIVSEGKVTEPLYFTNIKNAYKIPNANIVVDTDSDSSPCKILKRAEQLYSKAKKENDPFDKVYCVFDQDSHETYNQTIQKIKSKKPRNTFFTITSVPCFEFWLLLHFKYSSAPFHQTGKLSIAATALKELQKRFPDYTKDYKDLFSYLGDKKLRFAIDNAQKLRAHNQKTHQSNPSTNVDQLVT